MSVDITGKSSASPLAGALTSPGWIPDKSDKTAENLKSETEPMKHPTPLLLHLTVLQAGYGEVAASTHQRKPGSALDHHPEHAWEGCEPGWDEALEASTVLRAYCGPQILRSRL
ncbi:hypothetical protein HispidOSU_018742 [Sigmodon hispidus]